MDGDIIGQNEIEELLNSAGPAKPSAPDPPAADTAQPESDVEEEASTTSTADGLVASSDSEDASEAAAASSESTTPAATSSAVEPAGVRNVGDDVQFLLDQAEEAIASAHRPLADVESTGAAPFQLKDLAGSPPSEDQATLDLLRDVELDLKIELGRTDMFLEDVLALRKGSVVALDKLAGDPVDVYVNGRLVARGEVLVLNDNFCVRVAELISGDDV